MSTKRYYGCKADIADARDLLFLPHATRLEQAVDLRSKCPPVMDQGALGACVWHALTSALRYTLIKASNPDVPLSRLQGYYDTRTLENDFGDTGCEIRNAIKVAMLSGVAPEDYWPYDVAQYERGPSPATYANLLPFDGLSYERVAIDPVAIKLALSSGVPVVVGMSVFDSFESDEVAATGMVPMPDLTKESLVSAHAMLCVGFSQKPGCFTVRNSWGNGWGSAGDCYVPEEMLGSPLYTADAWIIRPV